MTDSAQTQELIHAVEQAGSPAQLVAAVRTLAAAQIEAGISTDCCVATTGSGGSGRADPYGLSGAMDGWMRPTMERGLIQFGHSCDR